jgi:hypothetical protein
MSCTNFLCGHLLDAAEILFLQELHFNKVYLHGYWEAAGQNHRMFATMQLHLHEASEFIHIRARNVPHRQIFTSPHSFSQLEDDGRTPCSPIEDVAEASFEPRPTSSTEMQATFPPASSVVIKVRVVQSSWFPVSAFSWGALVKNADAGLFFT